jgi:hypothetical protein
VLVYHYKQQNTVKRACNQSHGVLYPLLIGKTIMALKTAKTTTQPESVALCAAPEINLEEAIADQLLDDIDWQKVRAAIIRKAPAKLFAWLAGGDNTPINISQFPELAALPSSDDEVRAA